MRPSMLWKTISTRRGSLVLRPVVVMSMRSPCSSASRVAGSRSSMLMVRPRSSVGAELVERLRRITDVLADDHHQGCPALRDRAVLAFIHRPDRRERNLQGCPRSTGVGAAVDAGTEPADIHGARCADADPFSSR